MSQIEQYQTPGAEDRVFGMLERRVNAVIKSGLVPDAIRGKPADALLVALKGHELGLTFTASFSHLFVVNGKIGESAQLLADQAAAAGYDVYVGDDSDAESATAFVVNRRTGQRHSLTWTIEDARRAKLTEKTNWQAYPAAMLRARAISNAVRAFCRGVVLAADVEPYTPDELGADVVEFETEERELPPVPAPRPTSGPIDVPSSPTDQRKQTPTAGKASDGGDSEEAPPSVPPSEAPVGDVLGPSYAEAIHILAAQLELSDEALDLCIHDVTGDNSAKSITRENWKAVVERMRAEAGKAA